MKLGRRPDDKDVVDGNGRWLRDLPKIPAAPVPRVPRPVRAASDPTARAVRPEPPVARESPSESRRRTTGGRDIVGDVQHRFEEGDFAGALAIADAILAIDPSNDGVRVYAARAATRLTADYMRALGGDRAVLVCVKASPADLVSASIDPRAAFVLSLVDGIATVDDVVEASGLRPVDALHILAALVERGIARRVR